MKFQILNRDPSNKIYIRIVNNGLYNAFYNRDGDFKKLACTHTKEKQIKETKYCRVLSYFGETEVESSLSK